MFISDLGIFEQYGIKLNWDIIIYGLENHFLSYDFVESYLCDKLENQGGLLESEMNLLVNLIDSKKNPYFDFRVKDLIAAINKLNNIKFNEKFAKHSFQYLALQTILAKYEPKLDKLFYKKDCEDLCFELYYFWEEFNFDPFLRECCDYPYWLEELEDLEDNLNYITYVKDVISSIKEYLKELSEQYNWFYN